MRSGIQNHTTLAVLGITVFLLAVILPVSAAVLAVNGTVIGQGATVFIGEQGLNVTHALNQAYYGATLSGSGPGGIGTPAENNTAPPLTCIGWWVTPAVVNQTAPSKVIDLGISNRYASLTVAPADFVGYTGTWYLLDASTANPISEFAEESVVFTVQDPALDVRVWDFSQNADVTGSSVPRGGKLGFRIDTNMYSAVDSRYRSNRITQDTPAFPALPVYTANNVMIDGTGSWFNYTVDTTEVRSYRNYSSGGSMMTWGIPGGAEGGYRQPYQVFYYNPANNRFYDDMALTTESTALIPGTPADYQVTQGFPAAATDGFIDLAVRDGYGTQVTALYNQSAADTALVPGPETVLNNYVGNQPWFWGSGSALPVMLNADNQPINGHVWHTAARNMSNQYIYPAGTWTVRAESSLNYMRDNYKMAGTEYTCKTVSQTYTVTLVAVPGKIGVFRNATHLFYEDYNGNGAWNGGLTDRSYSFGITGDIPVTGDWNNDGKTEIGVYRPSTHLFYLDWNGNGVWNGALTDKSYPFGISGDIPVTGDWNSDGRTEIGVYRPSTHLFYLDWNGDGVWNGALTDKSYPFGISGDTPVTGDWTGNGITEIGVYRPSTHLFYLDWNGDGVWNGALTDKSYNFGITGDTPVAGAW